MPFDDVVLHVQRRLDRLIRFARLGAPPGPPRRRFLVVQIDGLSRAVLEDALAAGRVPFLARLLRRGAFRLTPMSVGLPSSTPAFQLAAMYGVRPDIPGFHYHDKRRRDDVYFPRGGDAAWVERTQAGHRPGVLRDGGAYGCVFTGGATDNLLTFAMLKRPTGAGARHALSRVVVLAWVVLKSTVFSTLELARAVLRLVADPVGETERGWRWLAIKLGISVWLRELFTMVVARDLYAGVPAVWVNYLDYDVFAHAYGPRHRRALRALRRIDRSIHQLWHVLRRVPEHRYDLYVLSDHGQAPCTPYLRLSGGRPIEEALLDYFDPERAREAEEPAGRARRVARGLAAFRTRRAPGLLQRFVNYLEHDFALVLAASGRSASTTASASCPPGPTRSCTSSSGRSPSASSGSTGVFPARWTRSRGAPGSVSCWSAPTEGPCASGAASGIASTSSATRPSQDAPTSTGSPRVSATSWPCRAPATWSSTGSMRPRATSRTSRRSGPTPAPRTTSSTRSSSTHDTQTSRRR